MIHSLAIVYLDLVLKQICLDRPERFYGTCEAVIIACMKLSYMLNSALHVKQCGRYKLIRADFCFKMQGKFILSIPLKDVLGSYNMGNIFIISNNCSCNNWKHFISFFQIKRSMT